MLKMRRGRACMVVALCVVVVVELGSQSGNEKDSKWVMGGLVRAPW
jgi:hypothetical protein